MELFYKDEESLLGAFNRRDKRALSDIYIRLERNLNIYSASLYGGKSVMAEDTVSEVILNLWTSDVKFSTLVRLKGYFYVSVKNHFLRSIERNSRSQPLNADNHSELKMMNDIIETEIYTLKDEISNHLPEYYAKILRLYLDGYNFNEIADICGETQQKIYDIKSYAIKILRKKMKSNMHLFMLLLIS